MRDDLSFASRDVVTVEVAARINLARTLHRRFLLILVRTQNRQLANGYPVKPLPAIGETFQRGLALCDLLRRCVRWQRSESRTRLWNGFRGRIRPVEARRQ